MIHKLIILSTYFLSVFSQQCFTQNDIITSNKLFSYNGNVYDITGYNHPGGKSDLMKTVGDSLENFVNQPKYKFHINSGRFNNDMKKLIVGVLKDNCIASDTSTQTLATTNTQNPVTSTQTSSATKTQNPVTSTTSVNTNTQNPVASTTSANTNTQNPITTNVYPTIIKPIISNNSSTIKYNMFYLILIISSTFLFI